jgi:hypothetical protein
MDLIDGLTIMESLHACHIIGASKHQVNLTTRHLPLLVTHNHHHQYLQSILNARGPTGKADPLINPPYNSLSESQDGVSSVQNGILLQMNYHPHFDSRASVILRVRSRFILSKGPANLLDHI